MSAPEGLAYVAPLIEAYRAGWVGDHMHLGLYGDAAMPGMEGLKRAQDAMARLHLEQARVGDGQVIVDVGCGLGGTLRLLNAQVTGAELIGVNIDPRQLAVAAEIAPRGGNRLRWVEGDASRLEALGLRCDRAVSLEAMFHFPDAGAFLRGARTMLRPGGRLVVSTILLAREAALSPPLRAARSVVLDGFARWPAPEMDVDGLVDLAVAAGFDVARTEDLTTAVGPTFAAIAPEVPAQVGGSATAELARLHGVGAMRYVMLTLDAGQGQGGGNTQK